MEVHFSPDQATKLAEIAALEGLDPEQLVKDAALRLLQDDADFRAAVRRGLEQADRGEFVKEEEMDLASSGCYPDADSLDAKRGCRSRMD